MRRLLPIASTLLIGAGARTLVSAVVILRRQEPFNALVRGS